MTEKYSTTEEAIQGFLASDPKCKDGFAYELCENVGVDTFLELLKKFSDKTVKFPKEDDLKQFLLGKRGYKVVPITQVVINV